MTFSILQQLGDIRFCNNWAKTVQTIYCFHTKKNYFLQNRPRDAAPPSSHQVPLALPLLIVVRFVAVAVLEVAGGGGGSGDAAIL